MKIVPRAALGALFAFGMPGCFGDYIHSRGLKFGIYSSPGARTCAGYAGSLGHEEQDAREYAAWGVDFLKYDLCCFQVFTDSVPRHGVTLLIVSP